MEKHIAFSVPIKKEHDNGKTTIYRLKIIDSCRFMQDYLVDNLSEINNNEESENNMRSMTDSLSQSIDKISEIGR